MRLRGEVEEEERKKCFEIGIIYNELVSLTTAPHFFNW
jgi:hypothetical protein